MRITRHAALWIAIAVTALVMLILLRHILLPFVVGMALAYLLAPIVSSLERLGINRAFATLTEVYREAIGTAGMAGLAGRGRTGLNRGAGSHENPAAAGKRAAADRL
jgi:hypothetical protein